MIILLKKILSEQKVKEGEEKLNEEVDKSESEEEDDEEGEEEKPDVAEQINNNLPSNQMSPISQGSPVSIGGYTPTAYNFNMLANNRTLLSLEKLEEQIKQKIHSRKFRE